MKKIYLFVGLWVALFSLNAQNVASFEEQVLESSSFWNGSDGSGDFMSGDFYFPNSYNAEWGSWSGFSISNMKDSITAGWGNQYSAITASGVNQSENYAVAYLLGELKLEFDNPLQLSGFYLTNSTYAYLSMKYGDSYTKKFGGVEGTEPDYFKLLISGIDIWGNETSTIEFFLADFTSENSKEDYILKSWEWVDLSSLGAVTNVNFQLESTDVGSWGMNTPAYFCIDDFNGSSPDIGEILAEADFEDLNIENESFYNGSDGAGSFNSGSFSFQNNYNADWASWSGFAASTVTDNLIADWSNQYSAITGVGAQNTSAYAVSYVLGTSEIEFEKTTVSGFYITNATYAYFSMLNGDAYSKKFGGVDKTEPDWFKVSISGISEAGDTMGTIEYYLADFRAENSADDYIIDYWKWVDLTTLGEISKLKFSLSSSDVGNWGMNTPAYFCLDQLNHQDLSPIIINPIASIEEATYSNEVLYVSLDSVFTDPDNSDSEMILKLENIDNSELLIGSIVLEGTPGSLETLLSLNISPNTTGSANITISATSNGKTVYHTFKMVVSVPVSVNNLAEYNFKVYPNPVTASFFVEVPLNAKQLILYGPTGEIIYKKSVYNENKIQISQLQNSPSGIYFLNIITNGDIITQKIVKL